MGLWKEEGLTAIQTDQTEQRHHYVLTFTHNLKHSWDFVLEIIYVT